MMANLAVFPKWHSSGTDNARATLTHIDGAEEQWLNLSDTNPVHTHSSVISQHVSQSSSGKDIGERLKATAVHAQSLTQAHVISA